MSNGTHDAPRVRHFPPNPEARAALEEWQAGGPGAMLWANNMDFRGVDISGVDVFETWAMESDFRASRLVDADLAGAHLFEADFREAQMAGIVLPNANATKADFSGAVMTGANLRSIEAPDSLFRGTTLVDSEISGGLTRADLRGADLRDVRFLRLDLREAVLCAATVTGARGVVTGPFLADVDGEEKMIGGAEAERWFADRGAEIDVLEIDSRS